MPKATQAKLIPDARSVHFPRSLALSRYTPRRRTPQARPSTTPSDGTAPPAEGGRGTRPKEAPSDSLYHANVRRLLDPVRRPVDLLQSALALLIAVAVVAVIVGGVIFVSWSQLTFWWRTDGPDGPHWGQQFICTEYNTVFLDRFNGTEEECVAGHWQP